MTPLQAYMACRYEGKKVRHSEWGGGQYMYWDNVNKKVYDNCGDDLPWPYSRWDDFESLDIWESFEEPWLSVGDKLVHDNYARFYEVLWVNNSTAVARVECTEKGYVFGATIERTALSDLIDNGWKVVRNGDK